MYFGLRPPACSYPLTQKALNADPHAGELQTSPLRQSVFTLQHCLFVCLSTSSCKTEGENMLSADMCPHNTQLCLPSMHHCSNIDLLFLKPCTTEYLHREEEVVYSTQICTIQLFNQGKNASMWMVCFKVLACTLTGDGSLSSTGPFMCCHTQK